MQTQRPRPRFNVSKLADDMTLKGWNALSLAKAAHLSPQTVGRFLDGEVQTPKTAEKLAIALGYSVRRYLVSARETV